MSQAADEEGMEAPEDAGDAVPAVDDGEAVPAETPADVNEEAPAAAVEAPVDEEQDETQTVTIENKTKAKAKVAELKNTLKKLKDQVMQEADLTKTKHPKGGNQGSYLKITNWVH